MPPSGLAGLGVALLSKRFVPVLFITVALLVPAAAGATRPQPPEAPPEVPDDLIPCITLDVEDEGPDPLREHTRGTFPATICTQPRIDFRWNSSAGEGAGSIVLELKLGGGGGGGGGNLLDEDKVFKEVSLVQDVAADRKPVDMSVGGTMRRVLGLPSQVENGEPVSLRFEITAAFHVRWTFDDCGTARGDLLVTVDDDHVVTDAPRGFFEGLCLVSHGGGSDVPSLAGEVATLTASLLTALDQAPSAALPDLRPLVRALDLVAVRATETPDTDLDVDPAWNGDVAADGALDAAVTDTGEVLAHLTAGSGGPVDEKRVGASVGASQTGEASPARAPAAVAAAGRAAPVPGGGPASASDPAPSPGAHPTDARPPPVVSEAGGGGAASPQPELQTVRLGDVRTSTSLPAYGAAAATATGVLALLAVGLYQRLQRPQALRHPVRAALHEEAQRTGGGTAGVLGAAVGVGRKSAEYHLVYLARLGLLRVDDTPGGRVFAPPTTPKPAKVEPLADRVLHALREAPGTSMSDLATHLGASRTRLDRCVKDLLLAGRLESRMDQGARRLYPAH